MKPLIFLLPLLFALTAQGETLEDKAHSCLIQTIAVEAGGESLDGQIEVALVILRRVESPKWPNNVCAVTYQPWQFTGVELKLKPTQHALSRASAAALIALFKPNLTQCPEADHYHSDFIKPPSWTENMERICHVGRHIFYKEGKRR